MGPGFFCELALMLELVLSIDSPSIWAISVWRGQNWDEVGNKGY